MRFLLVASLLFSFACKGGTQYRNPTAPMGSLDPKKFPHVYDPETLSFQKALEATLEKNVQAGYFPGISVGVIVGDTLVYDFYQDSEPTQLYGLASITKIFTAVAIMQLVEKGLINLDDPYKMYFPNLKLERPVFGKQETIRLRHFLSHTAGLPDKRYYKVAEFHEPKNTKIPFQVPLQIYPAGVTYRYANQGFMLLGEVIKQKTKKSLQEHYQEAIFKPLGMYNSKLRENASGAFGVKVTLPDLAKFAGMFLSGGKNRYGEQVLSEESIERMLQPQISFGQAKTFDYCGLALRVRRHNGKVFTFFHIGGANGTMVWLQMFPNENAAIIYMANPNPIGDKAMSRISYLQNNLSKLAALIVGKKKRLNHFKEYKPDTSLLGKAVGLYKSKLTDKTIEIISKKGEIYISENGGILQDFVGNTARTFWARRTGNIIDIVYSKDGEKIIALADRQGYYERLGNY